MTIPNTARKAGPLLGTGSQTAWPFTFKVFAAGDVQVTIANSAGTETLLVLGTDYTVTLNSNQETSPGGTVNYPISGAALPVGSVLAIIGDLDYDQPLDLPSGGNFSPTALENQLDRSTMQIQQLREEMNRTAKLPPTSTDSVEALVDDLQRIADSADNLDTIAANIAAVNTVASDLNEPVSEINTVATSIANVNAVGSNITDVNTVAGISANVTTVAGISANVTTVAGISANVTTVAGNTTNINTVAGNNANVTAVGANITNVNTVAANEVSIDTVAGIASNVSAVAAIDDAVSIAAANVDDINNFADVYQGGKASDPTVRNDGSALQSGDLYFNTTLGRMRVRVFGAWDDAITNVGAFDVETFSGTGSQTVFTLGTDPLDKANCQVYISGVYQQKTKYSVLGTTLTFVTAPPSATDNIEVVISTPVAFGNLSTIQADVTAKSATATTQAGIATTQAGIATTQAGIATTQAGLAATAKTAAEAARDAANVNARVYATTTAGLAATTSGQYFSVPATATAEYLILYLNSSGTAVEVKRYPATAAIDALRDIIDEEYAPDDYAYLVRDEGGRVALGIKNDGTVVAQAIDSPTIDDLQAGIDAAQATADKAAPLSTINGVTPVLTINDPAGRTAFEINPDGSVSVASLSSRFVNGVYADPVLRANYGSGVYDTEITYFTNTGQSLASGPTPAVTRTQEYDNVGFAARSTSPPSFLPLTASNCSQGGDAEPPMFGAMGSLKELVLRENGLLHTSQLYKLVATDNSNGSWAIAALSKGTQWYNTALSQATASKSLATAENKTFSVGGVFWTQGEADANNGYAYYLNALKTLAADYNTDFKAITGQTKDTHFITYQIGSTTANKHVALAQLQASIDSPLIHLACPMYQFDYGGDGVHVTSDSSKWLGGYYGLVYKRVAVDGVVWTPTRPMSAVVSGNFVNVKFHLMVKPLVIDTVLIPAQTNYGFTLVDSSNNPLTITNVDVSGPDTVKIVASGAIPAGAKLRYGFNTAVNKGGGYVSGCGNLRDSQGQIVTYYNHPLHNWCVFFEFQI